jgi:hypothetical protein
MRLPVLFALILVAAGCVTTPPGGDGGTTPGGGRLIFAPDCSIGNPDGNWTETCVAKASPNPSPSKAEIDVAANPKDPLNVIVGSKDLDRAASPCVWAVPQVSHDGGKSWKTVYIGGKKADRKPGDPLFGWDCITDPILVFDKNGVAHYSLQLYNFGQNAANPPIPDNPLGLGATVGSEIVMVSSKNGGDTWGDYVTLHAGEGNAIFHDYMRMASNPKTGTTYTIWNQISVVASVPVLVGVKSGSAAAEPPVYIPVPDEAGSAGESAIFAGTDGTVYVILGGINSGGSAYFTASKDDGATFSAPTKMFTVKPIKSPLPNSKFRVGTSVEGAIDRSPGAHKDCVYGVWADAKAGEGDADILSSASCDHGKTWSAPVRVNRDNTKSDQWMPRVAVGEDGTVHVVYMTRAYDPAAAQRGADSPAGESSANKLIDAEYAYSTDGGATWATKRLTTKSFDGDLGVHQDGFPFFGDYIGIDSQGARTYAAFPDSATGVAEIAVAALTKA